MLCYALLSDAITQMQCYDTTSVHSRFSNTRNTRNAFYPSPPSVKPKSQAESRVQLARRPLIYVNPMSMTSRTSRDQQTQHPGLSGTYIPPPTRISRVFGVQPSPNRMYCAYWSTPLSTDREAGHGWAEPPHAKVLRRVSMLDVRASTYMVVSTVDACFV